MPPRRVISTTALKSARTCLKSYEYGQVDRLSRDPLLISERVRLGIWVHRALDAWAKNQDFLIGLDECRAWLLDHGGAQDYADRIYDRASTLTASYISYWSRTDPNCWEVIASEIPLFAPLKGTNWTIRATLDKIVHIKTGPYKGELAVVEHKTTSDIPNATWRAIDPQTALQYAVARYNGYDVSLIIFDYLLTDEPSVPRVKKDGELYANTAVTTLAAFERCVPVIRGLYAPGVGTGSVDEYIRQARATYVADAKWFQRYPVHRPDAAVRESILDAKGVIASIEQAEQAMRYPRLNDLMHCSRMCFFSGLCASEYVSGGQSTYMREAEYVTDDESDREGR